jgi:hypothetical protein
VLLVVSVAVLVIAIIQALATDIHGPDSGVIHRSQVTVR